jgi:hypothetical protein
MGVTNFPGGVSSFGIPMIGFPGMPIPRQNGLVFFVDSNNGNDANDGLSREKAFKTADYAVGKCTANRGDIILVMPGHTETYSAAAGLDADVAGIWIIGIGSGTDMPTFTLDTATTADIDIDAANITFQNLHFKSGYADIAVCLDVNATDFTCRGCKFTEDADNENFLVCIQDAAAAGSDRMTIEDCYVIQDDASNTHFVNFAGTGKGHVIRRNTLIGDWGTMAIGGAGVVVFGLVADNIIYNAASDNDACISLAGSGICVRNIVGSASAAAKITATLWTIGENYGSVLSEDLSGILEPVAT